MHAGNHMGIMTTFKKPTAESTSCRGLRRFAKTPHPSGSLLANNRCCCAGVGSGRLRPPLKSIFRPEAASVVAPQNPSRPCPAGWLTKP
jgi:hypothetical protein